MDHVVVIGGIDDHQCLTFLSYVRTLRWSKFIVKCLIDRFVRNLFFIITSKNTTTKTYYKYKHYYNIISGRRMFDLLT
jgi:hypothetical protein